MPCTFAVVVVKESPETKARGKKCTTYFIFLAFSVYPTKVILKESIKCGIKEDFA